MLTEKEPFETEYIKMWISQGIFHSQYPEGLVVNLDIAKKIVQDRMEYTEGVLYPVLVDLRNITKVDFKAMKYWASEESYGSISKLAVYSDKTLSKIMFNFWLYVDKPFRPTRYFTDLEQAYQFLKQKPFSKN